MKLKMEILHVQRESVNLKANWMMGQLTLSSATYVTKFAVETGQKNMCAWKCPVIAWNWQIWSKKIK